MKEQIPWGFTSWRWQARRWFPLRCWKGKRKPLISLSFLKNFLNPVVLRRLIFETKRQRCSGKVFTDPIPMVSLLPFPSLSPREGKKRDPGNKVESSLFQSEASRGLVKILRIDRLGGGGGGVTSQYQGYANVPSYGLAISQLNWQKWGRIFKRFTTIGAH